ncbi:serine acetyltransferase [Nitrospira sp. NS4]|uniref:serine acetyltransferase n=1 Tax=Nitrospira sp. NS4 TaxID=3414498 RepID=UPI003C2C9B54
MKTQLAILRAFLQKLICCQIPFRYLNTVYFPHPVGVVIGSEVRIGRNVTIYQNVSIGRQRQGLAETTSYPTLQDHVTVYAGAVIMGSITIGRHAIVGANAVISKDVPPESVAFGYNQIKPRKT